MEVQKLQRYDLIERIAAGGMGEVFRARAHGPMGFEKTLAVKRILPELSSDREFVDRFISESKLAVSLSHANLVQVFDLGRAGDDLFLVMEYVHGADLARILTAARSAERRLPIPLCLLIIAEAAQGLAYAHGRHGIDSDIRGAHPLGIVHCDISPSNLLISYAGEVKLTDFGVAQLIDRTRAAQAQGQQVMGKWRYMAPEQIRGEPIDARTDLYALGVVLFEILTGRRAFAGDGVKGTCDLVLAGATPRLREVLPDAPPSLERFLQRLMAVDPKARPADARAVLVQLAEIQAELGSQVTALDLGELVRDLVPPAPDVPERRGISALLQPVVVDRTLSTGRISGGVVRRRGPAASFVPHRDSTSSHSVTLWVPAGLHQSRGGPGAAVVDPRLVSRALLALCAVVLLLLAGIAVRRGLAHAPEQALAQTGAQGPEGAQLRGAPSDGEAAEHGNPEALHPAAPPSAPGQPDAPHQVEAVPATLAPLLQPPSAEPPRAPRARPPGFLNIYAEPWANVSVDGQLLPRPTPLLRHPVRPGKHVILLRNPVLKRQQQVVVTVAEGQEQRVEAYLSER